MSSFVHEDARGNEFNIHLNENTGVVTMIVDSEDTYTRPKPIGIYDGSLAYPAMRSGFHSQTETLVRLEIFINEVNEQFSEGILRTRHWENDHIRIAYGYMGNGLVINITSFDNFESVLVEEHELEDFLKTLLDWLDKTINWCTNIEEGVL